MQNLNEENIMINLKNMEKNSLKFKSKKRRKNNFYLALCMRNLNFF